MSKARLSSLARPVVDSGSSLTDLVRCILDTRLSGWPALGRFPATRFLRLCWSLARDREEFTSTQNYSSWSVTSTVGAVRGQCHPKLTAARRDSWGRSRPRKGGIGGGHQGEGRRTSCATERSVSCVILSRTPRLV